MEKRLKRLKELLRDPFGVEEFLKEIQEFERELQTANPETVKGILPEYEEIRKLFFRNYEMLRGLWEVKRDVRA